MTLEDASFYAGARALGLKIKGDQISHGRTSGPIAGATARVETSGDIERRITVTRLLAVGVFALALRKKEDHRTLWLTIEGQGFELLVKVEPAREAGARRWIAAFNTRAMQTATP